MRLLTIFLATLSLPVFAQQESRPSMFWNVNEYFNPGATGMEYRHKAIIQYRNQWTGINGAPTNATASYSLKADSLNSGFGINGLYESIGNNAITKANANYSYHLKLGKSVLGIGLQAGITNIVITNNFTPPVTTSDPSIPSQSAKGTGFSSAAGLYYKWNNLTVGASATQIVPFSIGPYDSQIHSWFTASYELNLRKNFRLTPSVLFLTDHIFNSMNVNLRGTFYQKWWAGFSVQNRDSFNFMAGYDFFGKFRAGYCYEITTSRLNNGVGMSTHEAVIGFLLK